jgi:hypothetical protein
MRFASHRSRSTEPPVLLPDSPPQPHFEVSAMVNRLCSWMLSRTLLVFLICFGAAAWVPRYVGATTLSLSADYFQYFCLADDGPGLVTVHVLIEFNIGTTATRFRIQQSPEVTWSYISETPSFPTFLGNTQTGITMCFDPCLQFSAEIIAIQYMAYGTSTRCAGGVSIVPHPAAETVEVIECDGSASAAFTRSLVIGCECPSSHKYPGTAQVFDCTPLATRVTTWGAVKALYQTELE